MVSSSDAGRALVAARKPKSKRCPVCDKEFVTVGRGVYCSESCKQRAKYRRGSEKAMTGEELGEKLLLSARQMEAGQAARATRVEVPPLAATRRTVGLSQARFAALLGVSVRTLQDWEQGRRVPTGAARTLLRVAEAHPEVLRELGAG